MSGNNFNVTDKKPFTAAADIDEMVGDSGSGGTKGLVPAPAAGDAAAGKFLKADGTWAVSGGGVSDHGALTGLGDDDHSQYHTDGRADTWLGTKDTDDVAEGTNQYFTNARARAALAPAIKTAFIDKTYSGGSSDGSIARPYTTISSAVTGLGAPVDATDEKVVRKLVIFGGNYDEDVTVPQGNWAIIPIGFVHLGAADLTNFASTTPRKLKFQVTPDNRFNTSRPTLSIEGNGVAYTGSTHWAYNGSGFHISGDLEVEIVKIVGGFSDVELNTKGVKVGGNAVLTLTGGATGNVQHNMEACYWVGTFGATTWNIYKAAYCEFDGLLTAAALGFMHMVDIGGGVTFTSWSSSIIPNGFFNSKIAGTVTTGAGNYRVDGVTLFNSSPTLAGGATLALQEKVASSTEPGVVSISAQTLAGAKTMADTLTLAKGLKLARAASATNYTVTADNCIVGITDTSAPRSVDLPAASAYPAGQILVVKDESGAAGTNNITVNRAGADTIDGATSVVISVNNGVVRLYSDGSSKWFSI